MSYDVAVGLPAPASFPSLVLSLRRDLITGIPFAIAHEGSNAAFFFFGAPPLISAVGRLIPSGGNDG